LEFVQRSVLTEAPDTTCAQSRRLALLHVYDKFQQKGTVTDHGIGFDRLCMQLVHVGVAKNDSLTAVQFLCLPFVLVTDASEFTVGACRNKM
jgi:hypothetical protein